MTFNQKKNPARMLVTVVRSGDAPKPPFPIKTDKKIKKSANQFWRSAAEAAACKLQGVWRAEHPGSDYADVGDAERVFPPMLAVRFRIVQGCPCPLPLKVART